MSLNSYGFSAHFGSSGAASLLLFLGCVIVAAASFALVLGVWYPHQYQEMSAGKELFLLLMGGDVVIGPLLTLFLFTPTKSRTELRHDLTMVVACQLFAFVFGMYAVYQARPLFLVGEIDRFKTISMLDLRKSDYDEIPQRFRPHFFNGPKLVLAARPTDEKERLAIFEQSINGGPDLGELPRYYTEYDEQAGRKMLKRARPLSAFLKEFPDQQKDAGILAAKENKKIADFAFLPVIARADWVAVLDQKGDIVGFLRGDGFKAES